MSAFLLLAAARAAEGFDAHGFHLAAFDADPRDPLGVARPGRFDGGTYFVGGLLEYADDPLVRVTVAPDGTETVSPALDQLVAFNVSGGYAVHERVRLDLGLPVYFASTGLDGPQGAGVGDLRVAAMLALVRPGEEGGLGLGLVPHLDVPIGPEEAFLGQGGVSGGGRAALSFEASQLTVGGDLGVAFGPGLAYENLDGADAIETGLAVGWLFRPDLGLNLEGRVRSPFAGNAVAGTGAPAEATLSVRTRTAAGLHLAGGAAMGVSPGVGAAAFRLFLGGGFGRTEAVELVPRAEGGPSTVEVVVTHGGRELEGALLEVTAPGRAFQKTTTATPLSFPAQPGEEWRATATYGNCLSGLSQVHAVAGGPTRMRVEVEPYYNASALVEVTDIHGRLVRGVEVAWEPEDSGCVPSVPEALPDGVGKVRIGPGSHTVLISAPGFASHMATVVVRPGAETSVVAVVKPARVRVARAAFVILEPVRFAPGTAELSPQSWELLNEVAASILLHPELGLVEVAGHTDNVGADGPNLDLSRRRAAAVAEYLVGRGLPPERLATAGYGSTRPIADNDTAAGREANQRIEFTLPERAK